MNKSSMRLQLGALKRKVKEIEMDINCKDEQIDRLKEKTSKKSQDHMRHELQRSFGVLQNLKRKVGGRAYHEEYKVILKSIREVLGAQSV
jgi:predicted  nucleic acid-binding Zn-ribbon protein